MWKGEESVGKLFLGASFQQRQEFPNSHIRDRLRAGTSGFIFRKSSSQKISKIPSKTTTATPEKTTYIPEKTTTPEPEKTTPGRKSSLGLFEQN